MSDDRDSVARPGLSARTSNHLEELQAQLDSTKHQLAVALQTISNLTQLLDAARTQSK